MKVKYVDKNNLIWGKQLYLYDNDGVVVTKDSDNLYLINKGNKILMADLKTVVLECYLHNDSEVYFEKMEDEDILYTSKLGRRAKANLDTLDRTESYMKLANEKLEFLNEYTINKKRETNSNFLDLRLKVTRNKDNKEFNYRFLLDEYIRPYLEYKVTEDEEYSKVAVELMNGLKQMTGLDISIRQTEEQKVKKRA